LTRPDNAVGMVWGPIDLNTATRHAETRFHEAELMMKPGSSGSRRLPSGTPVLVVEDNDANRILALRLLEKLGYVATAARNGREALEAIAKDRYSLVLMDCQMPEMDGFEATRAIRRQEAAGGQRLPIVAMTASATERDRLACLEAGMDDFVAKPVMIEVLSDALARWHPDGEAARPATRDARRERPGSRSQGALDRKALWRLRDDLGPEACGRFLDAFVAELPGREAAILRAAQDRSERALRLAAHTLKSTSAAVGATALASLCGELEALGSTDTTESALEDVARLRAECRRVLDALEMERAGLEA